MLGRFCFYHFIFSFLFLVLSILDLYASVAPKGGLDISAKDMFMRPAEYFSDRNKVNQPFIHRSFEIDIERDGFHFKASFEPGNQERVENGKNLIPVMGTLKGMVDAFLKGHLAKKLGIDGANKANRNKKKQSTKSNLIPYDEVSGKDDLSVGLLPYIKDPQDIAKSALSLAVEEELKTTKNETILGKLRQTSEKVILGFKFGVKPKNRRPFNEKAGFGVREKPWGRIVFSIENIGNNSSLINLPELIDIEELSQEITLELGAKLLTYYAHFNNYFLNIKKNLVPHIEFPGIYLSSVVGPSFTPLFLKDHLMTWSDDFGVSVGMLVQPGIQDPLKVMKDGEIAKQKKINNINFKSMDELLLYFIEALYLNYDQLVDGGLSFVDHVSGNFIDETVARAFDKGQFNAFYNDQKVDDFFEQNQEVYTSSGEDIENPSTDLNAHPELDAYPVIDGDFIGDEDIVNTDSDSEGINVSDIEVVTSDSDDGYNYGYDDTSDDGVTATASSSTSSSDSSSEVEEENHGGKEILNMIKAVMKAHNKNPKVKFNKMLEMLKDYYFPPFMMSFNYGYRPEFRDPNNKNYKEFNGSFAYSNKHEIPWGRVVFIISSLGDASEKEIVESDIKNEKYMALIIARVLKNFEKMIDDNKKAIDNKTSDYYI